MSSPGPDHASRITHHADRLRFHVSIDPSGAPRVAVSRKKKKGKPWKLISRGSVTVKIYRGRSKLYTISWRESATGPRRLAMRSDPFVAVSFAETKATELANGETWRAAMGQNDWASLQRAREILAALARDGAPAPPIELACGVYADFVLKLPPGVTPGEVLRFYLDHQPADVSPQNIPDLVTSLIEKKRLHGKGAKWLRTLEQQLERFASHFTGPLHALRRHEISAWLDALAHGVPALAGQRAPVGLRTRKNYRDAIRELVRFAVAQGQLTKSWDELPEKIDPPPVEVEVYTIEQLVKLLAATRPNMIPFTTLQAFAGIRHEEMVPENRDATKGATKPLLDWRDINLDKGVIRIRAVVGKTKKLRLIDMHPNLVAWLRPHAKESGRICELDHTPNALVQAKHRAGIPAGRGQLTNALRSSFISYRLGETNDIGLVSREAGNSPNTIKSNYLELVSRAESRRWFDIWPTHADVLQLDFGLRS